MPSGYRIKKRNPEHELGIVPLVAAAAPALIGGIGSLFKKKKKPAAPAPAPAAATQHEVSSPMVVKDDSAAIPGMVKKEALAALQQYQGSANTSKTQHAELVKKLAAVMKPSVSKMSADVKKAALQRQVTAEHNRLMLDKERWDGVERTNKAIMAKFDELEAALKTSAGKTQRVFKIYGVNV